MSGGLRLLPAPREIRTLGPGASGARLGSGTRIELRATEDPVARSARECAERVARAHTGDASGSISLVAAADADIPREGYELDITSGEVRIAASDAHGLFYATGTLEQIAAQCRGELPGLAIRDRPDFAHRGYMLDVSRDRVPTRETLSWLVDLLGQLRINQLQLYTEHTFAYREHERVWADASPLTPDEISELDAHCAARGIELVPNQNSFGHMERWLRHAEYRHLAECPEGAPGGGGAERPPSCLAPVPESIAFMRSLYAELLPCFRSRRINIGCDETFELGRGRSRAACEARGTERVYLDYLLSLVDGLRAEGRTVQFWSDILGPQRDLLRELPRDGVVALAWGYEAPRDSHGFDALLPPLAEAGIPFYACPGTSSWNSLVGRLPNALANLRDAAEAGLANGALGVLITDWGDHGHLQPPVVSLPPLAYGAAVSWCLQANRELDLEDALATHLLASERPELVRALVRLGSLYAQLGLQGMNASPLSLGLLTPLERRPPVEGETSRALLEAALGALADTRSSLSGDSLAERELRQAAALARHGAWRLAHQLLGEGPPLEELRADLEAHIEEQARVWRARSRPGGLDDSLRRLRRRLADYSSASSRS